LLVSRGGDKRREKKKRERRGIEKDEKTVRGTEERGWKNRG